MPDVPLMNVSDGRVCCVSAATPWTAGMVCHSGGLLFDDLWQQVLINEAGWERCSQPGLRVLISIVVISQIVFLLDLVILVVPSVYDDRGMMSKELNVCSGFAFHRLEISRVRRIRRAGKEEVLPHKNSQLVAGLVKDLWLKDAASPDTKTAY